MFFSTNPHFQWVLLEDTRKREMATFILTLSKNKKFLGSLFFPLKEEKKKKKILITSSHTFEWKKNDLLTWLITIIHTYIRVCVCIYISSLQLKIIWILDYLLFFSGKLAMKNNLLGGRPRFKQLLCSTTIAASQFRQS